MADDFGDFQSFTGGQNQGILPSYKSVPTDVRTGRSFLLIQSALPRMYYDLKEQDRRAKLKLTKEK